MKVLVRRMRHLGENRVAKELFTAPGHSGILEVVEQRDTDLGRSTVRARLLDEQANDLVPELKSATLLLAKGQLLRLTGLENVDRRDYAQTWSVEVQ